MTKKKRNVALVFGGKSPEHEISLRSARNVLAAIDKTRYNPILIGISPSGHWHLYDSRKIIALGDKLNTLCPSLSKGPVALSAQSEGKIIDLKHPALASKVDVIFPLVHGIGGEDGSMQGLLQMAEVPYVGSDVLGSAIGMDKYTSKRLLREAGIRVADFIMMENGEATPSFDQVVAKLGVPFFVKPNSQGSSVGVSKVTAEHEYDKALAMAFNYDNRILIEQYIAGAEIECGVLGNRRPIASVLGEVICQQAFYSYNAKYIDEDGATVQIPAKLPFKTGSKVQSLAVKVFQTLCCTGLARVDFFVTQDQRIYVNEINTMPGFTNISMFAMLWQASGICYSALINRLIALALEQFDYNRRPATRYLAQKTALSA